MARSARFDMLRGTCHCGQASWQLGTVPALATACNCTLCRRYGALWAYGWLDHDLYLRGPTSAYRRADSGDIDFRFCPACGCVVAWTGVRPHPDGRTRAAVNLRLAEPDRVADVPVRRSDGLNDFRALPPDGRKVRHLWW